jgi:uncharacterized linocin/CFP29 family protein
MGESGKHEWSAQQWQTVQQTVYEEARRARVAARFLPLYGPVAADAETVPAQRLEEERGSLHLKDRAVLGLTTVRVNVELNTQQVAQPDLSAAITLFRRAANVIARVEDILIFLGHDKGASVIPEVCHTTQDTSKEGLWDIVKETVPDKITDGQTLVKAVAEGITILENKGYVAPYALALGSALFVMAETPSAGSLVLPSDRIRPLIEGSLARTGTLPREGGILFSLPGNPVEIVVAKEIGVTFLQVSDNGHPVYRVSERFVLRVKEPDSMVKIGKPNQPPNPQQPAKNQP